MFHYRTLLLLCLVGWSSLLTACAQTRVTVGTAFDLQGFIDKKIAAGEKHIVIPPGQYRVTPRKQVHLVLKGLKDIEIIAKGVEMICTETTLALKIEGCTNLTLSGLTIDYDPLPFTQGRITKLSADKRVQDIELFEGYPPADQVMNFKYQIFNQDTLELQAPDYGLSNIEKIDARHLRLTKRDGNASAPEEVGNLIVIGTQSNPGGHAPHAVISSNNVNLQLDAINLYASNCFGFLETNCDATVYRDCFIGRRTPETDLVKRGFKRLRSLNADAYHSKHALRGPQLIRSQASYMADDGVNICGDYHMVMAVTAPKTLRVLAKHDLNIAVGDGLELFTYEGLRLPDAKVVNVTSTQSITDDEVEFLRRQKMDAGLLANKNGALTKGYLITLDRDVKLSRGSVIASTNRMGNGFLVQDCKFGFNRSRGILIKASNGRIIGNTIQNSREAGIQIIPEFWWLESGSSSDLVVSGNRIINCESIGIELAATSGSGAIAPAGAHRNIVLTNNTFVDCPWPNLVATSTEGLTLKNNTYAKPSGEAKVPGWLLKRYSVDKDDLKPEVVINVK